MTLRRLRYALAMLVCISLLLSAACASPALPDTLLGHQALAIYLDQVNEALERAGSPTVNSLFICGSDLAVLGITASDQAEIPEGVEMTFTTYPTSLNTLEIRANDPNLFHTLSAACILAASGGSMDWKTAMDAVQPFVSRVKKSPGTSFEDSISSTDNGASTRTYFAYYPNQYQDHENWLQLTLIFPLEGYEQNGVYVTPQPTPAAVFDGEYEGIVVHDSYTHFEVFVTPTPEPDSPAGEALRQ